jgi:hypothetical protein
MNEPSTWQRTWPGLLLAVVALVCAAQIEGCRRDRPAEGNARKTRCIEREDCARGDRLAMYGTSDGYLFCVCEVAR